MPLTEPGQHPAWPIRALPSTIKSALSAVSDATPRRSPSAPKRFVTRGNTTWKDRSTAFWKPGGEIYASMGDWSRAVADYKTAADYARHISYWRGLSEGNGPLARAYEHQGQLQEALSAVNEAIEANERIPDELYFVPQNLA